MSIAKQANANTAETQNSNSIIIDSSPVAPVGRCGICWGNTPPWTVRGHSGGPVTFYVVILASFVSPKRSLACSLGKNSARQGSGRWDGSTQRQANDELQTNLPGLFWLIRRSQDSQPIQSILDGLRSLRHAACRFNRSSQPSHKPSPCRA